MYTRRQVLNIQIQEYPKNFPLNNAGVNMRLNGSFVTPTTKSFEMKIGENNKIEGLKTKTETFGSKFILRVI